ncbi:glycosyltransferase family 39 protein [Jongsikchunia kroppenstedtii]|uniref:glycosyltransferase family 39 protein n=1 Tax=Jongsikchunia kroppenstedtii TaxID=1121721 RepID=UPI00036CD2FF|nr:glycosyltransferase family 39 protein [Jongsikchunia kroppenstedtii]
MTILANQRAVPTIDSAPARRRRSLPRGRGPVPWSPYALGALLLTTALLYLWNLSTNGYANTFYAAAAQAGSQSWKAWFFGALDSSNFITVDKPPAALWVTGLSVRIFGMNSWAVLVPQALMGVATVALVYCTMRRTFTDARHGTVAGLIAGGILAFTPAAALMFRFNNPDALLVLLMVAAAYALTRALKTGSGRWLALVGVALGFAFLTKMLQGLLVVPGYALAYLLLANTGWRKRIGHLLIAGVTLVVSAGWFVVATMLVPASERPYIGGSTNNTFMDLVFGYNGVSRISGSTGGGPGGGGGTPGSSFGGSTGLDRLFSSEMGNEISWLLPVALLAVVFAVYMMVRTLISRREPAAARFTGVSRIESGAVIAWGGWLIVTGLIFSYMSGTVHPYYTVALAPAIAVMIALGSVFAWRSRQRYDGRIMLAAMIGLAAGWSVVLMSRNDFGPSWCRWLIGVAAALAVVVIVIGGTLRWRKAVASAAIVGALAGFGGTAAFSIATAVTAHGGSIPTAVNTSLSSGGGMGGGPGHFKQGAGQQRTSGHTGRGAGHAPPTGQPNGQGVGGQTSAGNGPAGGQPGGQGGPGEMSTSSALTSLLKSTSTTWAAATNGDQSAASIEIATGKAVMAIGGWSNDPAPTLNQFIAYVKAGKIAYYIGGGQGGPGGNSEIATWVSSHYKATTVGGTTVYKLT